MLLDLNGQAALVTGAGSGLGAAIARALAAHGVRCALAGRRLAPLEAVAGEIRAAGGQALAIPADVSEEAPVNALVAETVRAFGGLDIVVNSAGLFLMKPVTETTPADWDTVLGANLRGPFLVCRAAWPHLARSRGQVVNVNSAAAVQAYTDETAYVASKYGLSGLSAVLALEGRPAGIRVIDFCPAATDTPLWDRDAPPAVRAAMMKAGQVAELALWAVRAPRNLDLGPVLVRNFDDPWKA